MGFFNEDFMLKDTLPNKRFLLECRARKFCKTQSLNNPKSVYKYEYSKGFYNIIVYKG